MKALAILSVAALAVTVRGDACVAGSYQSSARDTTSAGCASVFGGLYARYLTCSSSNNNMDIQIYTDSACTQAYTAGSSSTGQYTVNFGKCYDAASLLSRPTTFYFSTSFSSCEDQAIGTSSSFINIYTNVNPVDGNATSCTAAPGVKGSLSNQACSLFNNRFGTAYSFRLLSCDLSPTGNIKFMKYYDGTCSGSLLAETFVVPKDRCYQDGIMFYYSAPSVCPATPTANWLNVNDFDIVPSTASVSFPIGAIIGIIVAGIVIVAIAVIVVCVCCCGFACACLRCAAKEAVKPKQQTQGQTVVVIQQAPAAQ